ncbi:hypothetical protein [Streptomyces sp. A5-4]|uniref:hypothetical protein n=1 Tax=Streptomyces sp. A5-4 TaxID=3384771 RepID=UPI003DA927DA
MRHLLSGGLAVLAAAGALVPVVRALRSHSRPPGPADASFRRGPLFAWCPAEGRETPHTLDAGVRRCRSCKTSTPTATSGETHG